MQLPPEGSERCRPGHSSGGMRATPHPYTKNILASGRPNRTNEGEIICAHKGGNIIYLFVEECVVPSLKIDLLIGSGVQAPSVTIDFHFLVSLLLRVKDPFFECGRFLYIKNTTVENK